jgi:hypothetical protein
LSDFSVKQNIESLNYDLSSQQSEVDRLREAVTDEGRDKLQRIRQARDEIFVSIQKYQAIRYISWNTIRLHSLRFFEGALTVTFFIVSRIA